MQYGKGIAPTRLKSQAGFQVVLFDYMKSGWKEEMANAGLVIGHAGAGTILDSLEARKPIIVVANDLLMSQHQTEIANIMQSLGHLLSSTPSKLMEDLPRLMAELPHLKVFPNTETNVFANEMSDFLGTTKKSRAPRASSQLSPRCSRRQTPPKS